MKAIKFLSVLVLVFAAQAAFAQSLSKSSSRGSLNGLTKGQTTNSGSRNQEVIAKFIVTNAKNNGTDVTEQMVNRSGVYTVFYTSSNQTYMANCCSKIDSQSWGRVYDFKSTTQPETSNSFKTDTFTFSWHYSNSYDSKTGTCKCTLVKIYKPQGIVSVLKMVTESLDVIEYTGYMEGSLDFSGM